MNGTDVRSVESPDGVAIAYRVVGTGPGLVILPGSDSSPAQWQAFADALAPIRTCYLVDRRGHGDSRDAESYSFTNELADVHAVLDVAGPRAALLGHSFGAVVALEAVLAGAEPTSLVLYEPPLPFAGPVAGSALATFTSLVVDGAVDRAIEFGLLDILGVTREELVAFQDADVWCELVETAPAWIREFEALDALPRNVARYRAVRMPTLCLIGERSAARLTEATTTLRANLPDGATTVLPGQGHAAQLTDPAQLALAVREFLQSSLPIARSRSAY